MATPKPSTPATAPPLAAAPSNDEAVGVAGPGVEGVVGAEAPTDEEGEPETTTSVAEAVEAVLGAAPEEAASEAEDATDETTEPTEEATEEATEDAADEAADDASSVAEAAAEVAAEEAGAAVDWMSGTEMLTPYWLQRPTTAEATAGKEVSAARLSCASR